MNIYDRSIEISTEISIKLRGHDFRPSLEISNKTSIETELSKVIVNKEDMLKWSDRLREYFSTEEKPVSEKTVRRWLKNTGQFEVEKGQILPINNS